MQEVKAKLRYLRASPRKMRLLANMIRGRSVLRATAILAVLNKQRYAKPLFKLLRSAVANAKHNFSLPEEALKVATITVDGGPVLKRWMPRAHGRATPVRERTVHINIILTDEYKDRSKEVKKVKKEKTKKTDKK